MVRLGLQVKALLENVADFRAEGEDFRWYLKVRCANCGEISNWVYATLQESVPMKGSRGSVHLKAKCKMCARENSLEILPSHLMPYTANDSGEFKSIIAFDCRGLEPVDFDPRGGFRARADGSNTLFEDISLSDKEWYDYDEETNQPVSITEVEYRFVKT